MFLKDAIINGLIYWCSLKNFLSEARGFSLCQHKALCEQILQEYQTDLFTPYLSMRTQATGYKY